MVLRPLHELAHALQLALAEHVQRLAAGVEAEGRGQAQRLPHGQRVVGHRLGVARVRRRRRRARRVEEAELRVLARADHGLERDVARVRHHLRAGRRIDVAEEVLHHRVALGAGVEEVALLQRVVLRLHLEGARGELDAAGCDQVERAGAADECHAGEADRARLRRHVVGDLRARGEALGVRGDLPVAHHLVVELLGRARGGVAREDADRPVRAADGVPVGDLAREDVADLFELEPLHRVVRMHDDREAAEGEHVLVGRRDEVDAQRPLHRRRFLLVRRARGHGDVGPALAEGDEGVGRAGALHRHAALGLPAAVPAFLEALLGRGALRPAARAEAHAGDVAVHQVGDEELADVGDAGHLEFAASGKLCARRAGRGLRDLGSGGRAGRLRRGGGCWRCWRGRGSAALSTAAVLGAARRPLGSTARRGNPAAS